MIDSLSVWHLGETTVDTQTANDAWYDTEYYPNDDALVRILKPEHCTECKALAWIFGTSAICVLRYVAFVTAAARLGILAIRFQITAIFCTICWYIVVAVGVLLAGRTLKSSKSYIAIS